MYGMLMEKLPPTKLTARKIVGNQGVPEIINEVVEAHKVFAKDYDRIAADFWSGSVRGTLQNIFDYCKREMYYSAETDNSQTTRSPAALLKTAKSWGVDCKHYAGFIAGVLDALKRQGKKISWCYRFVSYNPNEKLPEHVFVVVSDNGKQIFVDPVLSYLDQREPKYYFKIDKFPGMSLKRITGFNSSVTANRKKIGYTGILYDFTGGGGSAFVPSVVNSKDTIINPTNTGVVPPAKKEMPWGLIAGAAIIAFLIFKK